MRSSATEGRPLNVAFAAQAFPGPLRPGTSGVAGNVCWTVREDGEVVTWTPGGRLGSDEWRGLGRGAGSGARILSCGLVNELEKKEVKRLHLVSDEDGFALATGAKLYWKLPSSTANHGRSFDLANLGYLEEGETCTAMAGEVFRQRATSRVVLGTSRGRVIELKLMGQREDPEIEELYQTPPNSSGESEPEGFLTRIFTPRKSRADRNAVASIGKCLGSDYVIMWRQGEIVVVDSKDSSQKLLTKLQNGNEGVAVLVSSTLRPVAGLPMVHIVAKQSQGRFSLYEGTLDASLKLVENKSASFVALNVSLLSVSSLTQVHHALLLSGVDDSDSFVASPVLGSYTWGLSSASASSIVGVGGVDSHLLFLTSEGLVASTVQLVKSSSAGVSISQERAERLVRSLLTLALERAAVAHRAADFEKTLDEVLQSREEFVELKTGSSKVIQTACRFLEEYVRSKLCPQDAAASGAVSDDDDFESRLQEKASLIKVAFCIRRGLTAGETFSHGRSRDRHGDDNGEDDDDDEGEERYSLLEGSLQTTGEKLYAAIECISHEQDLIRREFRSERHFISNLDHVKDLTNKLANERSESYPPERRLGAMDSLLAGANRFALINIANNHNEGDHLQNKGLSSNLGRLLRPQILAVLEGAAVYYTRHEVQRSVADIVKRFQSLSSVAVRANPTNPDALSPLLRLGKDARVESLRGSALSAVKSLAEEAGHFRALIDACYTSDPEDLATLGRALGRSQTDNEAWGQFPARLFSYLVHERKAPRKAFELCETMRNSESLLGELNKVLENNGRPTYPEVAAMGHLRSRDHDRAAQDMLVALGALQKTDKAGKTLANLGMLCAFVGKDDKSLDQLRKRYAEL